MKSAEVPLMVGRLVLIEPDAHLRRGHAGDQILALAGAARSMTGGCVVIGSNDVEPGLRSELEEAGADVRGVPRTVFRRHGLLAIAADALYRMARAVELTAPGRVWWRWLLDGSRAFREASALALATRSGPATIVVLSANERLVGTSTILGGQPAHIRVVHDVTGESSGPISMLDRRFERARWQCLCCCTNDLAAEILRQTQPGLRVVVESFAAVDAAKRPTDAQRMSARNRLGLRDMPYGCMVGGWWPPKDIETVIEALDARTELFGLVVCGAPLDEDLLHRLDRVLGDALVVVPAPLDAEQKAAVYHGSTFTLVSRVAGASKESGLVADALRYRIPLVISDHDERIASALREAPWAEVFRAGDPGALAAALSRAAAGLPIPPLGAQELLGFRTATDQLHSYLLWDRVLKERLAAHCLRP